MEKQELIKQVRCWRALVVVAYEEMLKGLEALTPWPSERNGRGWWFGGGMQNAPEGEQGWKAEGGRLKGSHFATHCEGNDALKGPRSYSLDGPRIADKAEVVVLQTGWCSKEGGSAVVMRSLGGQGLKGMLVSKKGAGGAGQGGALLDELLRA